MRNQVFEFCRRCRIFDPAASLYGSGEPFKIYMADTGLLLTAASMSNAGSRDEMYRDIIEGRLSMNKGMILENAVAQILAAKGRPLLLAKFGSEDSEHLQEVDFVLADGGRVTPLEVKSGYSGKHASLDRFMRKYADVADGAYVVHTKDLRVDGEVVYLPVYMLPFIDGATSETL